MLEFVFVLKEDVLIVVGDWLGDVCENDVFEYVGVCDVICCEDFVKIGVIIMCEVFNCIFGVSVLENNGIGSYDLVMNFGIWGLNLCFISCLIVLMDGIFVFFVFYGQLQFLLVFVLFGNMDVIDVVCGGGVVCYGLQSVGGVVNFVICVILQDFGIEVGVEGQFSLIFL